MRTLRYGPLLLFLALAPTARAVEDMQAVAAVWSDFVSSLRRGDYPNAHALFSDESRTAMPYTAFVAEYGPLSSSREMVLAKPENQSTRLEEDWAEIVYGGVNPGTGRPFKVAVSLVRNRDAWGLVAARNEMPERIEAGARGLLRGMTAWRGLADAPQRLDELLRTRGDNPLFGFYRFETDGDSFRAMPLREGLRAFYVDAQRVVRAVGEAGAPVRRTGAAPAPLPELGDMPEPAAAPPPGLVNGLPEISEPSAFSPFPAEMAEPPPAATGWRESPPRPAVEGRTVSLPDNIQ